jgi:hypothetical protein
LKEQENKFYNEQNEKAHGENAFSEKNSVRELCVEFKEIE